MKCFFCEQYIGELDSSSQSAPERPHELYCKQHVGEVLHRYGAFTHGLVRVIFHTKVNEVLFEVELRPMEEQVFIFKITPQTPTPYSNTINRVIIVHFDRIIDIDPENAEHKIKTILTFS